MCLRVRRGAKFNWLHFIKVIKNLESGIFGEKFLNKILFGCLEVGGIYNF